MKSTGKWMKLEVITLSEVTQTVIDKCFMFSPICDAALNF